MPLGGVVVSKKRSSILPQKKVDNETAQLSIYDSVNSFLNPEITLRDFEELGKKRFLLLKWIENQRLQKKPLDEDEARFLGVTVAEDKNFTSLQSKIRELGLHRRDADEMSHHILRLACCSSEDTSKWMVAYETVLFERRYISALSQSRQTIHHKLKIEDELIHKAQFINDPLYKQINGKYPLINLKYEVEEQNEKVILPYHKVLFYEVCDLVSRRHVFMQRGYAFVPHERFYAVVKGRFRSCLNKSLATMRKNHTLNRMRGDEMASRLVPILESIPAAIDVGYKNTNLTGGIMHTDVLKLKKHMPLCMQLIIDEDCMKKKYLRHWGILHLGLFLKGIGLPLQEANRFWQKCLKDEKKIKEVCGNSRHMYGASGAKKDYTPFGCYKLAESVRDKKPEKNCHYGCPYAYYSESKLTAYLQRSKMPNEDIKEVLNLKKGKHYGLACKKVFESRHRPLLEKNRMSIDDIENQWDHPNRYFDSSYHLHFPDKKPTNPNHVKHSPIPAKFLSHPRSTPPLTTSKMKSSFTPPTQKYRNKSSTPRKTPTFGKRAKLVQFGKTARKTPVFGKKAKKVEPPIHSQAPPRPEVEPMETEI